MALVLCTGVDRVLLRTRALILESAGHKVVAAGTESEISAACRQQHFDVAVLGQAMRPLEKAKMFQLVRAHCPDAKVLELYQGGRTLPTADAWLEVPADVPTDLAAKVSELAAK